MYISSDNLKIVLPLCNASDYYLHVKVHHILFFFCVILEYLLVSLLSNNIALWVWSEEGVGVATTFQSYLIVCA